jgi:hypothetical protein
MAAAKPLLWSRKLYRSIKSDAQADYVDVGSPIHYSRALFQGLQPRLPGRWPFAFRSGDAEKISEIYARHIFGDLVQ